MPKTEDATGQSLRSHWPQALTIWAPADGVYILLICSMVLLGLGIAEHTSVTGKDEYYLGLRVPLCMHEQDLWLVPCLDGEPRLRKPPMLYWLSRASLEIFGPSLISLRAVAVIFSSLFITAISLIALELGDNLANAIKAGIIALSCLGLAVTGRILELDVPTATWSAWGYLGLLRWFHHKRLIYALAAALCLAAGFLTKGPIVLIVCGGGLAALLISTPKAKDFLLQHWAATIGILLLFMALALPWFWYVHMRYPIDSGMVLETEFAARRFPYLSVAPLTGLLLLALPWSFVMLLQVPWAYGQNHTHQDVGGSPAPTPHFQDQQHLRVLWLVFTLLPFFLVRTFERYLVGSLVPLALLLALPTTLPLRWWRWAARLGLIITLPVVLILQIVALHLHVTESGTIGGWMPHISNISGLATAWYCYQWWWARDNGNMAIAAALLWACMLGLIYPQLGINQIPAELLRQVQGQEIVFYHGPQPAMLPAVLGRSLVHVDERWLLPARLTKSGSTFLLFTEEAMEPGALQGLKLRQFKPSLQGHFGILSANVTWANMWRPTLKMGGTHPHPHPHMTTMALLTAIWNGNMTAMVPQVLLYRVHKL